MNLRTAFQTTNSHEYTPIAASSREGGSHQLGEGDQEAQHEVSSCSLVSIRGSTAVFGMIGIRGRIRFCPWHDRRVRHTMRMKAAALPRQHGTESKSLLRKKRGLRMGVRVL